MTQLDITVPIEPGRGAAGITLGDPLLELPVPVRRTQLSGGERLDYACVSVWIEGGVVAQIGVRAGYAGKLAGSIGVGSCIADIEATVGQVAEDEDNVIVPTNRGWCFETEEWRNGHDLADNLGARITRIFVNQRAG